MQFSQEVMVAWTRVVPEEKGDLEYILEVN